jgi:hypothetical protein
MGGWMGVRFVRYGWMGGGMGLRVGFFICTITMSVRGEHRVVKLKK